MLIANEASESWHCPTKFECNQALKIRNDIYVFTESTLLYLKVFL